MRIRYNGRQIGPVPYYGKVTGLQYRIGKIQPVIEVDDLDAAGFLSLYEGAVKAFVVEERKIVKAKPKANPEGAPDKPEEEDDKPEGESETDDPIEVEDDDLTVISGIGQAKQKALNEHGIRTFEHLAGADALKVAGWTNTSMQSAQSWIDEAIEKKVD